MADEPKWVAAWVATGFLIAQFVLTLVLDGGEIDWLRYAGFVLWAHAVVLGWVPIVQFKKAGGIARGDSYMETTRVVDTGLYAIVRHPQFLAWPLMAVALALVSQHLVVIALGAAAIALSIGDFRKADARNIEKFGEQYRDYMERVPGWNLPAGLWRRMRSRKRARL